MSLLGVAYCCTLLYLKYGKYVCFSRLFIHSYCLVGLLGIDLGNVSQAEGWLVRLRIVTLLSRLLQAGQLSTIS